MGPTNSGKTQYLVNQLRGPFRGKFDFIVLFCPTFVKNTTYDHFVDKDPRIFVVVCLQHEIKGWLKLASYFFEKTNTLFVLDDCVASSEVKGRTSQLVNLGFSARHDGISVWVLTQQITSIAKSFRENVAAIVLFYTPSGKTTKAIFEDYAGEITHDEYELTVFSTFPQLLDELRVQTLETQTRVIKAACEEDLRYMLLNRYPLRLIEMPDTMTELIRKVTEILPEIKRIIEN